MSWIRLDDDYIYHPKFAVLSHAAFRLWHEGMAYCRKMLTDGLIPRAAMKTFRYAARPAVAELTTPIGDGLAPLWEPHDVGFKVHDYLVWNRSREQELKDREDAKGRAKKARDVHRTHGARVPLGARSVLNMDREEGSSSEREFEGKPIVRGATALAPAPDTEIAARAGQFLDRYAELFVQHRRGARLKRSPALDFPKACDICTTWTDDERLEKLAVLVLTTDDDWIARTDRGFSVFAAKATWADDRLAAWEAQNQRLA